MKKVAIGVLIVVVLLILTASVAMAGQSNDSWQRVHIDWWGFPYEYSLFKQSPNGVTHWMWNCDSNYTNCTDKWLLFPRSKFTEMPENDDMLLYTPYACWTTNFGEYYDDDANIYDFILPCGSGETYWLFGAGSYLNSVFPYWGFPDFEFRTIGVDG